MTGDALISSVDPRSNSHAKSASSPSIIRKILWLLPLTSSVCIITVNNESPPHRSLESSFVVIEFFKSATGVAKESVE